MNKAFLTLAGCIAIGLLFGLARPRPADAHPTFANAFLKKYIGDKSTDAQKSLAREFLRVKKCSVCHDPRKGEDGKVSKKNRNPYGQALNKFLTEKDKKDLDKAIQMMQKVEGQKAKGADQTFGQRLQEGKLPFEYLGLDLSGEDDGDQ